MSHLVPIPRSRFIPVFAAMVVLAATVALKLGVTGSHAAVAAHSAVSSVMNGYVYEDDSIGLNFADGTAVGDQDKVPPTIPPGTYTINVDDAADIHNFHLFGPGVDMATDTGGESTPTWTVTFQPGSTYKFQCDTHFDFMWGEFQTSGTAPASSTTPSSSGGSTTLSPPGSASSSSGSSSSAGKSTSSASAGSQSSLLGTLIGTVSSGGTVTLTWGGIPVKKIQAGRYKITVGDKAKTQSFVLQQKGHAAKILSSVAAVGDHTVTLSLTAGTWTFYSSAAKKKTSFTVS